MNKRLNNVSSIVLVVLLAVGVIASVIIIQIGINLFSKAGATNPPQNITVANIWNGRFGIAFETPNANTQATLSYGTDQSSLGQTADDAQGKDYKGAVHLFNITGLQQNTTYYYKFLIDSNIFDNSGQPYSIKTLSLNVTPFQNLPTGGKIDPANSPCLVYSHAYTASETSTPSVDYVAANGTYVINLDYLLHKDTNVPYDMTQNNMLTFVKCADGTSGGVLTSAGGTPTTITLSNNFPIKNYDNSLKDFSAANVTNTPTPTSSGNITNTPTPVYSTTPVYTPIPSGTSTPVSTRTITPTPTKVLPHTDLADDAKPFVFGIILIIAGLYLWKTTRKNDKY